MTTRIVVLGAGYSGLVAAQLVARHADTHVTLVNANEWFVERVRLHQVAAGQQVRRKQIAQLLGDAPVELVIDRAVAIDAAARAVRLAGGDQLEYDMLVYAIGSQSDVDSVPGVAEHAYPVAGVGEADLLRERLAGADAVTVVGAGLTGLEAATELAETTPALRVRLVTEGQLGAALSNRGRAHLWRVCRRLGIEVRENARVTEVDAHGVHLAGGERLAADAVIWTTGFRVPELASAAGFTVDGRGRLVVDDSLRSVSHPEVFGIGDAAAAHGPDGNELRMACATGLPQARHIGRAIGDLLAGKETGPLRFRYVNQCISLGRRDGLIQYVRADDTPIEAVLTGRLAATYKEVIVRSALAAQRFPDLVRLSPGGGRSRRESAPANR
ncbi:NADH dehydrogenase FAD-containing subunit [Tamaricihabitans halophyticus]|uniref:NADH dehydrogenase FAD-containing subunit n=1 Tax=Tamaricihabitans halophyticus TaxID=1262583 RepID=A0A4R2QEM8_9PSEU|nr:FAD-dependent oxidoreductase [Tamaricihabitans halophyticus]TCP46738.1 NADH dehydrogenase FAD-containing subunit [Tamaricihabitans halophyticus]